MALNKRKTLLASCILALATAGPASAAGEGGPPTMPVMVVEVKPGDAVLYKDYPGRVRALRTAEVRARVDGIVRSRDFVEGSQVAADDALFHIDDRQLRVAVRTAEADVDNAEATHALNQATLQRYAALVKRGGISQLEYETQKAQAKQSAAGVEQAKARLESAQINLDYAVVDAPIAGRIGRAMVSEGALVNAGASTLMATIEQIDTVYVDFNRPGSEVVAESVAQQQAAREVEVLLGEGAAGKRGELQFADRQVDESTGSVSLRALVPNEDQQLLPGMFVRVKVPVQQLANVLKVPQKAVQIGPRGAVVHTVVEDRLQPIPVRLGPMAGTDWVVEGGLDVGTPVVVSDISMIQAMGASVVAMPAGGGGANADAAAADSAAGQ